jgi:hypothetical protein
MTTAAQRRIATFLPPVLVGLLALPFVLHQNSWWEWNTALWLLERQTAHVSAHGVPTFFVHTEIAAFNPFYVFYAGFLFSVLAYPATVLGAWPVFAAVSVGALVAGYLGIWWTARNLGLSRRLAILPGLVFATTPYLLADLYGRGAWAEFVAVNAAAVMLGGLTALVWHRERRRGRALAALVGSGAILAGTHNITLLLCALMFPVLIAALLPVAPAGLTLGGLARRLGLGVLAMATGVGLTGAWLIPNLWLGPGTYAADATLNAPLFLENPELVRLSNVLIPWPSIPADYSGRWVYTQPPVLAMAWALAALLALIWTRRRAPDRLVATSAGLLALGAALLVLMVNQPWWAGFPRLLQAVQFTYRLVPYVAIVIALAISVAITAAAGRWRRPGIAALVVAVAAQAVMAVFVVLNSEAGSPGRPLQHGDIRAAQPPPSFSATTYPVQTQFLVRGRPTGAPTFRLTRSVPEGVLTAADTVTIHGKGRVGEPLVLPVAWSPLVRLSGDVRLAGRESFGLVVGTVARTDGAGRWTATAHPRCAMPCVNALTGDAPWQLLAGQLLTLVSAVALGGAGVAGLRRRRSRRRRPPSAAGESPATAPADVPAAPTPASAPSSDTAARPAHLLSAPRCS